MFGTELVRSERYYHTTGLTVADHARLTHTDSILVQGAARCAFASVSVLAASGSAISL